MSLFESRWLLYDIHDLYVYHGTRVCKPVFERIAVIAILCSE